MDGMGSRLPSHPRLAVGMLILGVVVVFVGLSILAQGERSAKEFKSWESVNVPRPNGRVVVIHYLGGGCNPEVVHVVKQESPNRVVLTLDVVEDAIEGDCSELGVDRTISVKLAQPIGKRKIVDGYFLQGSS